MDALNIPLEMIATCAPDGALRPARFRLPAEGGGKTTVRLRRIESVKESFYVGAECFRYICRAELDGRERRFELCYAVREHRWALYRFLD